MSDWCLAWLSRDRYPRLPAVTEPCQQNELKVWSSGYLANREPLAKTCNLPKQATESQVLIALYERFGAESAARSIAGPYSWVLWDAAGQTLAIVSDRLGLAPIYFLQNAGDLWVSCDLEALFAHSGVERRINPLAMVACLCSLPIPEGHTLYENVFVLPPATIWTYAKEHNETQRYWQLELLPALRLKSDQEYAEALRDMLVPIVDEHIPQDGFALTLSSGMDSSSLAGALRLARPHSRIPCISWVMPDLPEANEEAWLRETGARLDLDVTVLRADRHWPFQAPFPARQTPGLLFYQEVWAATFQQIKERGLHVLVDGAPGDLCFGGGISSYPDLLLGLRWKELYAQVREELVLSDGQDANRKTPLNLVLRPLYRYLTGRSAAPKAQPPAWLHPEKVHFYERLKQENRPLRRLGLPARVERWRLIRHTGPLQVLLNFQQWAGRFEVELRHPLYDHRILEFSLRLPAEQTYHAGMQKYILRNAMRGVLPESVVELRRKILPTPLFHLGLRERSVEQAESLLRDMRLAEMGYILPEKLEAAYREYRNGSKNYDFYNPLLIEAQLRTWD